MRVIADTGFLVALQNAKDRHHAWAVTSLSDFAEPLLSCEPVLVEAAYLLGNAGKTLEMLSDGLIKVDFDIAANLRSLEGLAEAYKDRQPDLCDLCIVRMSELFPEHRVVTIDRRDFTVYRRNQRELIPLILPPE